MKILVQKVKEALSRFFAALLEGKYVLFTTVLETATAYALYVYIARVYSISLYGEVSAVLAFAGILASVFEFGFNTFFQKETAAQRDPQLSLRFRQASGLRLLFSFPFIICIFLYFFFRVTFSLEILILLSLSVFAAGFVQLANSVLLGNAQYRKIFIASFAAKLLFLLFLPFALHFEIPFEIIILVFVISRFVHLVLSIIQIRPLSFTLSPKFPSLSILNPVFRSSLPMAAGLFLGALHEKTDLIFIQFFKGSAEAGLYAAAYSIYKIPQLAAGLIITPLFTNASKIFNQNGYYPKKFLRIQFAIGLMFSIFSSAFLFFFGGSLILLFSGKELPISQTALLILLAGVPGLIGNNITGVLLNSAHRERKAMSGVAVAAALNLTACFVFIPMYGLFAGAVITVFTEYCIFIFQLYYLAEIMRAPLQ